jgi:aspartate aminotransferase
VKIDPNTFDLDLDAIKGAITERTRAIIVNTPNNPTGKIYPPERIDTALGEMPPPPPGATGVRST